MLENSLTYLFYRNCSQPMVLKVLISSMNPESSPYEEALLMCSPLALNFRCVSNYSETKLRVFVRLIQKLNYQKIHFNGLPSCPIRITELLKEERISLLEYLPENTLVWIKDLRETQDIITKAFDKAADSFHAVISISNNTQVVQSPSLLYETSASFTSLLEKRSVIEFGKRAFLSPSFEIDFENQPQPSFNKNFEFLVDSLGALQHDGFHIFIFSDSEKQLERLATIFEEIDPSLSFSGITGSLNAGFISPTSKIACLTDHQIFDRINRRNENPKFNKKKALTLRELKSLQTGDYVVHIDHGVARFAGLDKVMRNGNQQEVIRLVYRDNDLLYVSVHALHKISNMQEKRVDLPPPVNSVLKIGKRKKTGLRVR